MYRVYFKDWDYRDLKNLIELELFVKYNDWFYLVRLERCKPI